MGTRWSAATLPTGSVAREDGPRSRDPGPCRRTRSIDLGSPTQYASDETTSPPAAVTILRRVTTLMLSLMNRTLPSPKRQLTPPLWYENSSSLAPALLPAVRFGPGGRE